MADRNMLYDPFGNPAPEMRAYQPAWHDRVVNRLTDLFYGDNANAQQRSNVNMLAGPENPLNIPAQVNQGYNTLSQGVALRDPAQAGIGVAQMAMSLPFGIAKGPAQAATKGIKAYHGSPHDFDRFSLDKIGTGEGAQSYGHGLYFAENEGVAKSYRDQLGDYSNSVKWKGSEPPTPLQQRLINQLSGPDARTGQMMTAARLRADLGRSLMDAEHGMFPNPEWAAELRLQREELKRIEPLIETTPPGRMYEVNIKANPEDFLDWDKPLSQQSEKVRAGLVDHARNKAAKSQFAEADNAEIDSMLKSDRPLIKHVGSLKNIYGNNEEMSQAIKEAGVPGIKYFDQNSRTAGEGSRNYVVFDDSLIEILRKYGLAGLMAGGAAATATDPASAAQ